MSFNYNPEDKTEGGGGKAQPGDYTFKVDQIEEVTFRTGSEGWKAQLLVGALADKDIKVFCNLVNTKAALWKMAEFLASIGLDFNNPPKGGWEPTACEGKVGKATFKLGEKGYLEVEAFLPASANNGPDARKAAPARKPVSNEPPPPSDDDCPPF